MYQLVLASASPRRRQLLKDAGFSCLVHPSQVSEKLSENMTIDEQLLELARRKADAVFKYYCSIHKDPFIVLAADTEVVLNGRPLGKPESELQAIAFLKLLSGAPHEVKTAMCFVNSKTQEVLSHIETTQIDFRSLTDQEILDYVKTGECFDRAGGYAIQGLGGQFVASTKGSWTNVVGLPVEKVVDIFKSKNWIINS